MKKVRGCIYGLLASMVMMTNTAYAMPNVTWGELACTNMQSIVLSNGEKTSTDITDNITRGKVFSTGMLEITNQQDGTLHISVDTYAHVVVDKIYQTVFLDVWDEDKKDWVKVNHWDFVKSIEEEPRLSSYHVGFTVSGCEVNKYYRARAMHLVEWGDNMEGKATETDGVLLTDHEI